MTLNLTCYGYAMLIMQCDAITCYLTFVFIGSAWNVNQVRLSLLNQWIVLMCLFSS